MITLYLIRHAETVDNEQGRIQGHTDSPLSQLGRRQAAAVADRLAEEKFAAIYSSDLGRAAATAAAIASRHGLAVRPTELLREAYLGLAQGLNTAEFEERFPEDYRLWRQDSSVNRPPGAERLESVIERCGTFLKLVGAKHTDGEQIAAVVHGGSMRGTICAALGLPAQFFRKMHSSNVSISILELNDRPILRVLNDTCHLAKLSAAEDEADNANG